jgi:hypothetical protein
MASDSNWKQATDARDVEHETLLRRLVETVHEAKYAGTEGPISQPMAHRVLYAAWRYVQYLEQKETK